MQCNRQYNILLIRVYSTTKEKISHIFQVNDLLQHPFWFCLQKITIVISFSLQRISVPATSFYYFEKNHDQ